MEKKVNVLIIDSGIFSEHDLFVDDSYIEIYDENMPEICGKKTTSGHGTAIYGIIRKSRNCSNIYLINISDIENGITEEALINVLKYVKNYEVKFDVINLSLGISLCSDITALQHVCQEITDSGTIIVSAFNNDGSISYPAAFDNVIGVTSGYLCLNTDHFEVFNDNVVNIAAKGGVQRLAWDNPAYVFLSGNSFACAHVTNRVIELIYSGIKGIDKILDSIKKEAVFLHSNEKSDINYSNVKKAMPFKIHKAVLFPFNKEMHNLVRFHDMLDFEVVDIYESKYSMYLGSTTTHVMKGNVLHKKIKNIKDIEWDSFDTLIIGHTDKLSHMTKSNIKKQLISNAIERGKNIYSYDYSDIQPETDFRKNNVYVPSVTAGEKIPFRYGMLYRISAPVLAILGTSSAQGKFTLQLNLRKRFLNNGYDIGQIGTEPNSLLFGMDYAVPMGYNSTVNIYGNDMICYINNIINNLSNKDIILVGTQAGSVLYDEGNLNRYNVNLYSFLLGANPDAVVLCVNPYDTIEYIQRTIYFIESGVNTKVIALSVFPLTAKGGYFSIHGAKTDLLDDEYFKLKKELSSAFNLPVVKLDNDFDMDFLFDKVIDYFT